MFLIGPLATGWGRRSRLRLAVKRHRVATLLAPAYLLILVILIVGEDRDELGRVSAPTSFGSAMVAARNQTRLVSLCDEALYHSQPDA